MDQYDFNIPGTEKIIEYTEQDILNQMTEGFKEHLFFLWILFIIYIFVENYKGRIPEGQFKKIWEDHAFYVIVIISVYYPILYIMYG